MHNSRITRRTALTVAAGAVAAPFLSRMGRAADDNTVVFVGWGGNDQDNIREIYFKSFEKETGIKVIDQTLGSDGLAQIKTMAASSNMQWDVVHCLGMWIPLGVKQNLWEELDYSVIQKGGVDPGLITPHSIGFITNGIVLVYNTDKAQGDNIPKSWADFWNTDKFDGARGLQDAPRYTLEFALLADGVAAKDLYPLDVDRAFKSLDKIKDKIHVWWKQWPQVPVLLASGELVESYMSDGRIVDMKQKEHAPVDLLWKDGLLTVDPLGVPIGAPHKQNAMKLINWMIKPELQAEAAKAGLGPSNNDAGNMVDEAAKTNLPAYHFKSGDLIPFSDTWWSENNDEMLRRWNEWKQT